MDLKEIIKWFIPCFHILLYNKVKMLKMWQILCLFLLFFARPSYGANVNSLSDIDAKNLISYNDLVNNSESDYFNNKQLNDDKSKDLGMSIGRTFGRPFKKMAQALIPLAFQIGAASTWMVVAAIVGVKTLMVALVILKLLLLAGAVKVGAFFAQKTPYSHGWEPHQPQKEIHLHIHGQQGPHEEHIWNPSAKQVYLNPYTQASNIRPFTIDQRPS